MVSLRVRLPSVLMSGPANCLVVVMVLCISNAESLKSRCREIYDALIECSAFVNWRRMEKGEPAVLALSFYS